MTDEPKYQHGVAVIYRELAGGQQLVMICEQDCNMMELTLEQARVVCEGLRNFIAEAEVAPKWELVEETASCAPFSLIGRRARQHSNSAPLTIVAVGMKEVHCRTLASDNLITVFVPFFVEVKR